jgi:uncharacterized protein with HEPN domain
VPWNETRGLRNVLVHEYFSADPDIVWQTLQGDLVPLRLQIDEILKTEFPDETTPA